MTISLYGPYDYSEATTAAIRLASLVLAFDIKVQYLATRGRKMGVHSYWDLKTLTVNSPRRVSAAKESHTSVWFSPSKQHFEETMSINPKMRNILIPCWHAMDNADVRWLHWYDRVVCPTEGIAASLLQRNEKLKSVIQHAPWSSGLATTPRDGLRDANKVTMFMPLDSYTQRMCASGLVDMFERVLSLCHNAHLVVVCARAWRRSCATRLQALHAQYGARLITLYAGSAMNTLNRLFESDVVIYPSVYANLGMHLSIYGALGLPVVAWDVHPASHLVDHGINGVLVPCAAATSNGSLAEEAVWSTDRMVEACCQLCSRPSDLVGMMGKIDTEADDTKFFDFWVKALELV